RIGFGVLLLALVGCLSRPRPAASRSVFFFCLRPRPPPISTLFPYTTLFRSGISSQDEDATGPSPAAGEDGGTPEPNGTQPPDRPGGLGFVGPLRDLVRRIVRSGRSTPGQLSGFTVVIVLLAVVVAVVCSVLLAQRAETTDRLTTQREPLAAAAQE